MKATIGTGVALVSLGYFLFTLHDATIKILVETTAVWQILFFRSLTITLGCALFGGPSLLRETLGSPVLKPMLLRGTLLLCAWLSYYTAARSLNLAELTTLYYAAPVVATVLAVPLLGERVTPARWAAVACGFAGVLIATNPASLGISLPVYLALQAACFWALGTVLLRRTAMQARSIVQMSITNVFFIVATGIGMLFVWKTPTPYELSLSLLTGLIGGGAQLAFFEGMRRAPVSVLAPFEYSSLIWAFALAYAIWGDVPSPHVFAGAVLIIGAGAIIVFSERLVRFGRP